MANEVKSVTVSRSAFAKTLSPGGTGLASSAMPTIAGQQTDMVTNSSRFRRIMVSVSIKLGSSTPTGNKAVYIFGIRGDGAGTPIRDDGAAATKGALTRKNADFLYYPNSQRPSVLSTGASPAAGDVLTGVFIFEDPGPEFGLLIAHDTAVNLDNTETNHVLTYWNADDEIQ